MKLNKKVIESMTVASAMVVMSTFTTLAGSTEESVTVAETKIIVLEKTGTAGIIAELQKMQEDAANESGLMVASIERTENIFVTEGNTQENAQSTENSSEEAAGISGVLQEAIETADVPEETAEAAQVAEAAEGALVQAEEAQLAENIEAAEEVQPEQTQPEENVQAAEAAQLGENVPAAEAVQPEENIQAAEAAQPEENVPAAEAAQPEENVQVAEEAQPEEKAENEEWASQVMANVEEDMNIRTAPDESAELAGKFYRGDVAQIVEVGEEWTEIASGNVTGFVKNDYLVYGDEAYELANEVCSMYATVNTDGLRLRSEPSEEAGIVTTASTGEKLKVDKEAEAIDGWVAVKTSDATAYVSADYVDVALNLGTALSNEEVKEKEAAKAAEEAKKAGKKPAMSASMDEVTLLGALIQCEAGNSSYEGMLAVGAVVMNRVRSGGYPGSISGVIYQAGQFPPALNGSVANIAAGGVRSACLQAAQEAIGGADNTNGALQFRSASSGYGGTVIGGNVFF